MNFDIPPISLLVLVFLPSQLSLSCVLLFSGPVIVVNNSVVLCHRSSVLACLPIQLIGGPMSPRFSILEIEAKIVTQFSSPCLLSPLPIPVSFHLRPAHQALSLMRPERIRSNIEVRKRLVNLFENF